MNPNLLFQEAIALHQAGNSAAAAYKVWNYIRRNLEDEIGWLVYANLTSDDGERKRCLERVLAINPDNLEARSWLESIRAVSPAENAFPDFVDREDDFLK